MSPYMSSELNAKDEFPQFGIDQADPATGDQSTYVVLDDARGFSRQLITGKSPAFLHGLS